MQRTNLRFKTGRATSGWRCAALLLFASLSILDAAASAQGLDTPNAGGSLLLPGGNFGPGDSYQTDTGTSWAIGSTGNFSVAVSFVNATARAFRLDKFRIAANWYDGTNTLNVGFWGGSSDLNSAALLESFTFSAAASRVPQIFTAISSAHPMIQPGGTYFITLSVPGAPSTVWGWQWNDQAQIGYSFRLGNGPWAAIPGLTPVFDVYAVGGTSSAGDFNGDGKGDLLLRNKATGQNIGWLMNGLAVSTSAFMPTIADVNWEVRGRGDFDGDGRTDVVLRNKFTGQNIGWLMNGLTVSTSAFLPTIADTNWEIKGVGDVDGNGKADVILRNKVTGQDIGWLMNGLTVSTSAFLPTIADTNWDIKGVGDFNGDGKADVILRNKVTGQNIGWLMNGLTVSTSAFLPTIADTNWDIKGVGDFDGDGRADVILRNGVTGQDIGWLMNGLTVSTSASMPTIADTNWDVVGQGQ